jgi:hypothetical protein
MKKIDNPSEKFDESFRLRKLTRSLGARRSELTTERVLDPITGVMKVKMKMKARRFGDNEKIEFLEEYSKWGRMGESCQKVGFSLQAVRHALETDEVFAAAFAEAELVYKEKLLAHHQNLVFKGQTKRTYDRNGNLISKERVYPIRLIELELKKHDAGYREKQEIAVNHSGGVVVAPSEVGSVDDWEKKFSQMRDVTPSKTLIVPEPPLLGHDDEEDDIPK